MSNFSYKGRNIYYEVQGEGKPILILNGIMMSTKSWEPFIKSFTERNQLIRVDFIDQGQSDKLENSAYTLDLQVDVLETLVKHLGIHKVNIVGISYGGEVATMFAIKFPYLVDRIVLFNTTPYTSPWLAEIGHQWNAIGKTRDGYTYYKATIPVIYSPSYFEARLDWMKNREKILIPIFSNPVFLDAMERLTNSAESYDVRKDLDKITAPTLIVAADEDALTPIANQVDLHHSIKNSEFVILPGVGHASMYERPLLFVSLVLGFINTLETEYKV